jgi:hypothetical protein
MIDIVAVEFIGSHIVETGLQICWTSELTFEKHFIEILYSNPRKSSGGPLRAHHIYQHLGIAYVFYEQVNRKTMHD